MVELNEQLQHKINTKTKPLGALGTLETIAHQIGMIQQTLTPTLNNPTIIVFAADHGLADAGVSPFPKAVTQQMVLNFLQGGAAINVFCKQNNIHLKIVDAGVDADFTTLEGLIHLKIANGTKNCLHEPAMTKDACNNAIKNASYLIQQEYSSGCNIIGFGEMGIGNTSAAALIMHAITYIPIEECVGRGTGLDNIGLLNKLNILKQVIQKHTPSNDPHTILATFGGYEIAMITGAILEAHKQNMIILIDGFIATSALLVAQAINKDVLHNCIFTHLSDEHGHQLMLNYLHAKPLLQLGMRLGEGTGAAVALPIIQSASSFLNNMASFESAGVSNI